MDLLERRLKSFCDSLVAAGLFDSVGWISARSVAGLFTILPDLVPGLGLEGAMNDVDEGEIEFNLLILSLIVSVIYWNVVNF